MEQEIKQEELSQEEITFQNTCGELATGDYNQYLKHPNSVGAICQWLKAYRLLEYDRVIISSNGDTLEIRLWGRLLCWSNWDKELNMPIFTPNYIDLQFYDVKQRIVFIQENYMKGKDKYKNPYAN